jgi:hypothetical protein
VNTAASLHIDPNPIYPNGELTIRYYNGDQQQSHIEIKNEYGRQVYKSGEMTDEVVLHTVTLKDWKPGIYVLELITDKVFARRIIQVLRRTTTV